MTFETARVDLATSIEPESEPRPWRHAFPLDATEELAARGWDDERISLAISTCLADAHRLGG